MLELTIAWTCVGVFIATSIMTLLAMLRIIELADRKYLDRLVGTLVLEVCAVCVAAFSGLIEMPNDAEKRVREEGAKEVWDKAQREVDKLNDELKARKGTFKALLDKKHISLAEYERITKPMRLIRSD